MANDLAPSADATPASADRNVGLGNNGIPELDMSLDAMASMLAADGQEVPVYQEAVSTEAVTEKEYMDALPPMDEAVTEEHVVASDDELIEAEPMDEIDDGSVGESGLYDVLSFEDLVSQVEKLEIGGKEYSPADLRSILGQEVSAGQKAREASDRIRDIEVREAQLAHNESLLTQRGDAQQNTGKLAQLQGDWNNVNQELAKARSTGDVYQMTILKDRQEQIGTAYNVAKQQIDATTTKERQSREVAAVAGLKARGLEYLTEDTPQAQAWSNYAASKLSASEMDQAALSPALADVIEKARKWDSASSGEGKKLVSKAKTLKKTGRKAPSVAQKTTDFKQRASKGQASVDELTQEFNRESAALFRPIS